ncbi:MAG: hypothetical protein HON27_04595 [Candidatus Marinimicrobia bacterium]|jgi:hypothetical protein|nr:hypothetical protein [Candidatus Neomarinimicrobiota bacterium]MBT6010302.1 hypothetical protein [Candidatus Neomarinimicrobiota bacterium]
MNQLKKIQSFTEIMINKFIDSRLKWAFIVPILHDQAVIDNLKIRPNGAFGIQFLRIELYLSFLQALANLISDSDKRSASIENIIGLTKKPGAKQLLRESFTKPMSKESFVFVGEYSQQWKDQHVSRKIKEYKADNESLFDNKFDKVIATAESFLDSQMVEKLKSIRDKTISHYEVRPNDGEYKLMAIEDFGLTWDDGIKIYKATRPIVEDLGLYIRSTGYAIDFAEEDQNRLGTGIWNTSQTKS